jgi:hypothetical protein
MSKFKVTWNLYIIYARLKRALLASLLANLLKNVIKTPLPLKLTSFS